MSILYKSKKTTFDFYFTNVASLANNASDHLIR